MTPQYVITRTRYTVTSICRSCGDTSGTTRTDAQAERWQRSHQAECPPSPEEKCNPPKEKP